MAAATEMAAAAPEASSLLASPPLPPPAKWRPKRLLLAAPALLLLAGLAAYCAALHEESAEGPPPPPSKFELKMAIPNFGREPHIAAPPPEKMVGEEEEGCEPGSDEDCTEGDELLDADQRRLMEVNGSRRLGAKPHGGKILLWPGGVVKYYWDSGISAAAKQSLQGAMKEWEAKTCISFQEAKPGKGVVRFKSSGKGCNAHVGYSERQSHYLNLEVPGCTRKMGTGMHELGHTIGLRHEHIKPKALEHIKFDLRNAKEWWKQWLRTEHDTGDISAGVPYDMSSIMHYGPWTGAKKHGDPAARTILETKPDGMGNCRFGQREYLSVGDILTVNRWYGCPDHFCADLHQHCGFWKGKGYCNNKWKDWMGRNCPDSCGKCTCEDLDKDCPRLARQGYCHRGDAGTAHNKRWMIKNCRRSCGNCLLEDAQLCKDEPVWGKADGCAQHKSGLHEGKPWCHNSWFASKCPKSCNLCPHQPYCW